MKTFSKKFFAVLLSILMVASMIPTSFAALAEGDKVDYVVTVLDSSSQAIDDASVSIEIDEGNTLNKKTNSDGNATFNDLTVGEYTVNISADNYVSRSTLIQVSAETTSVEVNLNKELTVAGSVASTDQEDVENLTVTATTEGKSPITADINGSSYSFKAEEGLNYEILATADYCVDYTDTISVSDQDITKDIEMALKTQKVTVTIDKSGKVKIDDSELSQNNDVEVALKKGNAAVEVNAAEGYHIKSVAGDVQEFTNAETTNDAINAIIEYSDTITLVEGNDYTVNVVFEINKYDVVAQNSSNATLTVSAAEVEHGQSATVVIKPNYGYNLTKVEANSTNVNYIEKSTDSYETSSVENITENVTFVATLEEYEGADIDDLLVLPPAVNTEGDTYFYADDVEVSAKSGFKGLLINETDGARNVNKKTYTATTKITKVDAYDTDTMKWYTATTSKDIVIDRTAPIVALDELDGKYSNNKVTITGKVTDEGGSKAQTVVYSATALETVADIKACENVVSFDADGKFSVEMTTEQNTTYYFYAIDYAEKMSEVNSTTVKIDKTKPVITNVEFSDNKDSLVKKFIKFFSFGTISNSDVYVKVTAKDANNPSSSDINNIVLTYSNSKASNVSAELVSSKNDVEAKTKDSLGGTVAVYTFKIAAESLKSVNEFSTLEAVVTDNAGNSSTLADARNSKDVETNAHNYDIMISLVDPYATITTTTSKNYIKSNEYWYNDDVEFEVKAFDGNEQANVHCGIQSVVITVNGVEVKNETYTVSDDGKDDTFTSEETYTIKTSDVAKQEGENIVKIVVTNNNGQFKEFTKTVFIDRKAPKFDAITIEKIDQTSTQKIIRFLSFGAFFNEKVKVNFDASDDTPSSDIKNIYLYKHDVSTQVEKDVDKCELIEVKTVTPATAGAYIASADFDLDKTFNADLYVVVEDNVGNKSTLTPISEISDEDLIESNRLNLENDYPKAYIKNVCIENSDNHKLNGYNAETYSENDAYYAIDKKINVKFKEESSGLYSASSEVKKFDLEGNEIKSWTKENKFVDESKEVTEEQKNNFDYSGDEYVTNGEGKYVVTAKVEDNAGNESEAETKTFFVDTNAPRISGFDFKPSDKDLGQTDSGVKEGNYGYFFTYATDVTITADDVKDVNGNAHFASGVNYIDILLVDMYGQIWTLDDATLTNILSNEELVSQRKQVSKDNTITVQVPQGFKGQIYAWATDNVGHTGAKSNPNGVVIEDVQGAVTLNREIKTEETDVNGLELYNEDVTVSFEVVDADDQSNSIVSAGIRRLDWTIDVNKELNDSYREENRSGYIIIDNNGEISTSVVKDFDGKSISDYSKYFSLQLEKTEGSNLIHKVTGNILVSNDSNDITLTLKATDRSGNEFESSDNFSIDKTAPVVQLTYADDKKNTGSYTQYYNFDRVATITVTERNFDLTRVLASLSNTDPKYKYCPSIDTINTLDNKGKSAWKAKENSKDPNNNTYTYIINYSAGDGIYDFAINSLKDRAGNMFDKSASTYKDKFVIDRTTAQLTVDYSYIENGKSLGSYPDAYNNKTIRATFTLVDHNADVIAGITTIDNQKTNNGDVKSSSIVSTNSKADGVRVTQFPTQMSWKKVAEDTYVATFDLTQQAAYEIKVSGRDMAGNEMYAINTTKFVVDTIKPIVKIEGIKQVSYAAYNDEKITPSVSIYDEEGNLDESSIKITCTGTNSSIETLTNHPLFDFAADTQTTKKDITNGVNYVSQYFNNEVETKDDIYTLHVEFKDLANNAVSNDYRFSVNRYGSTYIYNMSTEKDVNFDDNSTIYAKSILGKILFTEVNCDFINRDKTELSLTYTNTQQQKQTQIILKEGIDYIISKSPSTTDDAYNIKSYAYQLINADLFEFDGVYQLFATTYDAATNVNISNQEVGDVKVTQQLMKFVVDKTAPRISTESNFEKYEYANEEKTVISNNKLADQVFSNDGKSASLKVDIDEKNLDLDAIDKSTINVKYDGKLVNSTVEEVNGVYQLSFDLASTTKGFDLVVEAGDKAGNKDTFTVNKLLVSNNAFIRFINNTPALVGTICGVVGAAGIAIALVILKKKKTKYE